MSVQAQGQIVLKPFEDHHLPDLVEFWNRAFAERRNFHPITATTYRRRILNCPAFDAAGLILAWYRHRPGSQRLVGLVHAFQPPPRQDLYLNWNPIHTIALLYVHPQYRRRGVGSRLLQAAENWLYYCPVHVGSRAQPGYALVEGPKQPFWGSTDRLGVNAQDMELLQFLAKRGYRPTEPGDVSMVLDADETDTTRLAQPPTEPATLAEQGLELVSISHRSPFRGREPGDVQTYRFWGENDGDPYYGLGIVDGENVLWGHVSWYPMADPGKAALINLHVAVDLREQGLGSYLLDLALHRMLYGDGPGGGYRAVELETHLERNLQAVRLYQQRGFEAVEVWAHLVKT